MSNLEKRLANIFKGNPKAKKLYYTEDEQIFTKENKADAHASILGGKRKVSEVDRESLAKATKSTEDNKAKEPAKAKGKGSKKADPKKEAPKEPAKEDKTQKEAKASDADEAKAAEKAATDKGASSEESK